MALPRFAWGRPADSLPWKMLFKPISITPTYVWYLGLMYQPPTPRTKLPRVIHEGREITTSHRTYLPSGKNHVTRVEK